MGENVHNCRFGITDQEASEIGHAFTLLRDLGEGNSSKGLDLIRENHRWLYKQRQRGDKLSAVVFYVVVTAVITGLLTALWAGMRALLLASPK